MSMHHQKSNSPTSEAMVIYKKQAGMLQITDSSLRWIPKDGPGTARINSFSIDHARLQGLFSSKDGKAKAVLKISAKPISTNPPQATKEPNPDPVPDDMYQFHFNSPTNSSADKETFKLIISRIIAENKLKVEQQQQQQQQSNGAQRPLADAGNDNSDEQAGRHPNTAKGKAIDPLQEWRLKKRVLQSNPDLRHLHKEMVIGGQISEGEFWEGREELLYHEARVELQKSGRSAQMVDPRPETVDGGEIRISITPQMIRDIFEQYPVVQKVYNENVPPLNDQTFWTRYFRSKLFNRHRSSARQTGDAVKDDEIFDRYLDDDDDGIEPKHVNTREVFKLLDLAATQEDHVETGNSNDWTMRAGTQRSSLPLMRRFNEHSQRLLDSSLGKMPEKRCGGLIDGGDAGSRNYYGNTELEDLHLQSEPERIVLDMQDRERYFEGNSFQPNASNRPNSLKRKRTIEEEEEIISRVADKLTNRWSSDLGRFVIPKEDVHQSTRFMLDNIYVRASQKRGFDEASMPKDFLNQMVSTYTTTNEFLRQFWSSILPNPTPSNTDIGSSTAEATTQIILAKKTLSPEEKALKAQRMVNFLCNTHQRVDLLIQHSKTIDRSNQSIVFNAFHGLLNSVKTAQNYYRDRTT